MMIIGNIIRQELQSHKAVEWCVLGFVDHTHAAGEFLNDATVRHGLTDHRRESYVCETGKSMKAVELGLDISLLRPSL
jgi:hypothetical protein